ncbi:TetR/AcrR family transcriptional regulator [Actinokineospora xionganensis]|uniref:TetR/AcrR family transcriptional regulator n=1 Tax=Actinokineospora xionganensis TaxID=2684470 RepID=A0ABR7L0H5_9PSEU|nr:TetR/AcrR family transcriptional regulator [Actinokineospora xionganensis]MBC6445896.1 TetR/AcrR family transcriptional regulator [Actinokineospora xionganensis]
MRQAKTDRRSRRTQQLLMRALMDLLRRKRYHAITVQDIVDEADVGRSTFYAHFTDKDDLLVDGVHRMLAGLDEEAGEPDIACPYPTAALLRHLGDEADLYAILAKDRGLAVFLTAMQEHIAATLTARLTARLGDDVTPSIPPALLAALVACMLLTSIRLWIEGGLTLPVETVDRMFHTAATATIDAGLRPR